MLKTGDSSGDEEFVCPYERRRRKDGKNLSFKKWSEKENLKYAEFLQKNRKEFADEVKRRSNRVFKKMQKKIKKRTAEQCRTHHQKMLKKFHSIESIISYFGKIRSSSFQGQQEIKEEQLDSDESIQVKLEVKAE